MKNVIKILSNPLLISIVGLISIAIIVWFAGPMIGINDSKPLESETTRLITILVLTLLWGLNNFRSQNKQKKKDASMLNDIASSTSGKSASNPAAEEENKVLQKHFNDALGILRASKKAGSGATIPIHELPWYIIIGPPGCGKTTALINSGLRFPLAEKMGQQPLKGIGGTRNCDWWFTDEAVLIDTAGRYTTQDSDQNLDSAGWSNFCKLLQKHRARQPINGALVAISLSELMMQSQTERQQHANLIKQRLQELYENLGIQFPVYVLFTKTDLIAGFNEFFDNIARVERQQIWGMTFPVNAQYESQFDVNAYREEYDQLLIKLNERIQWRLHEERDLSRRALILGFPDEFSSLKNITSEFLDGIFKPNNFVQSVNLRGVYFTSGTQEGTPIDRVIGSLAQNYGLDRQIVPAYSGQGKSYFLTELFQKLVFPEAMLAGTNRSHERKLSIMRKSAFVMALLITVASAATWTAQYTNVKGQIDELSSHINTYEKVINEIAQDDISPAQLLPALEALQQAQAAASSDSRYFFSQAGLGQMDSLGPASDSAYERTLQLQFFPRIVSVLEEQLKNPEDLDKLFITLKAYLMLAIQKRLDKDFVKQRMVKYWEIAYPGNQDKQTKLIQHFDKLMKIGFEPILLNETLVSDSREQLKKIPLAQRIYASLKQKAENSLDDFFLSNILDSNELQLFKNKKNPDEAIGGVPGLFTKTGYESLFLEESVKLSKASTQDDWVFGEQDAKNENKIDSDKLHAEVETLYVNEFIKRWTGFYASITLADFRHFENAIEALDNYAGDDASLMRVISVINTNTDMRSKPSLLQKVGEKNLKKLGKVGKKAAKKVKSDIPLTPVGKRLRKHFTKLIALSESVKGKPPVLQSHLNSLLKLQEYLNEIVVAADPDAAALQASITRMKTNGKDIIGKIRRDAKKLPTPIGQWFTTTTVSSWQNMLTVSRKQINAEWKNTVLLTYEQSIQKRYPIFKSKKQETSIEDFTDFFAPDGQYASFINSKLAPFIKTGNRAWKLKSLERQNLGVRKKTLKQLRRGILIGKAFFPKGAESIQVKFRLKPKTLDAKVKRFTLTMDEDKVVYRHGPTRTSAHKWPFNDDPETSKISIKFETSGNTAQDNWKGSWAIFQMLDSAKVKSSSSADKFNVTFSKDGYTAKFELKANSTMNPFKLSNLHAFRCPSKI